MAVSQFLSLFLFLFPAFSSSLFALSVTSPISENKCVEDLQRIELNIAHLESKLEEVMRNLDEKGLYIEEQEKRIQQMSEEISILQSSVLNLKIDSSRAKERLNALEQEVQLLWATSRKNNFDIHVLESKARDTEERLEIVSSQAREMDDIVTEQWIQIQRLEQALHTAEMRTLKAKKVVYSRCSFLRFINKIFGNYLQQALGFLDSYIHQFKNAFMQTKEYHHKLQRFIKLEMEKNEFTAALANGELVFFVCLDVALFAISLAWDCFNNRIVKSRYKLPADVFLSVLDNCRSHLDSNPNSILT